MKPRQCLMLTILVVVPVLCAGLLLSGCKTTGDAKKDAGTVAESPRGGDNQSAAVQQKSAGSPQVRKEPVAAAGGSGQTRRVAEASPRATSRTQDSLSAGGGGLKAYATRLRQAAGRFFSTTLPAMNWNRIGTVLVGIVAMSVVYGLAFALARLRPRKRGGSRLRVVDRPAATPEVRSPAEPAYRAG
jgi:hypothetical protein